MARLAIDVDALRRCDVAAAERWHPPSCPRGGRRAACSEKRREPRLGAANRSGPGPSMRSGSTAVRPSGRTLRTDHSLARRFSEEIRRASSVCEPPTLDLAISGLRHRVVSLPEGIDTRTRLTCRSLGPGLRLRRSGGSCIAFGLPLRRCSLHQVFGGSSPVVASDEEHIDGRETAGQEGFRNPQGCPPVWREIPRNSHVVHRWTPGLCTGRDAARASARGKAGPEG